MLQLKATSYLNAMLIDYKCSGCMRYVLSFETTQQRSKKAYRGALRNASCSGFFCGFFSAEWAHIGAPALHNSFFFVVTWGGGLLSCLTACLHANVMWTAHSQHQEDWAGHSWSSTALRYDVLFS
jgi:hypothetical protein